MGAKRTHELIPFCHPLGLENCRITIDLDGDTAVIRCTVSVHHKTGVEMEALTGASIAALTIYDMCKALSHDIVIGELRLLAKDGGQQQLRPEGRAMSPPPRPCTVSILAGGSSSRMQRDKAALQYRRQDPVGSGLRAGRPACATRCSCPCAPARLRDPAAGRSAP